MTSRTSPATPSHQLPGVPIICGESLPQTNIILPAGRNTRLPQVSFLHAYSDGAIGNAVWESHYDREYPLS